MAFGGNPNSVTIFGNSAGGASTTYLMMTPLAKGLNVSILFCDFQKKKNVF